MIRLLDRFTPRGSWIAEAAQQAHDCKACPLHEGRIRSVFSRGSELAKLMLVGEAPGAEENQLGEPFVGASGKLLDKMIASIGLGRDDVYVCNVIKCRPPNNRKPLPHEVAQCMGFLRAQIASIQPKVIVALGSTAAEALLGIDWGFVKVRGKWHERDGTPVMPTYHPAYLLRVPAAKREAWADMKAVAEKLGLTIPATTEAAR